MPHRRELDREERGRARLYEAALALGVALLAGGLLFAFGLVLYTNVLSPREPDRKPLPGGVSALPPESPAPPRP